MSAAQPSSATIRKLAPVLIVDAVEPCLPFWTELLGFAVTAQVPEGERIGFAILEKDGVEIMYQSRTSADADVPALATIPAGTACLFIEVSDVEAVARALDGTEIVVPRRQTFYGMDEIGAREPGGSIVMFAQPVG
jgi:uncharacterized glyoxalase superfamily protein PhnB